MLDSLPIVLITHDDLLQLRHSLDTECATLERGLTSRQNRVETVFSLYLESQEEQKSSFEDEYRFQQRIVAISRALMDYIDKSIRTYAEVFLGSSDFFHFLRVALDTSASSPEILHTLQSRSVVRAVTQHRGVILQLALPTETHTLSLTYAPM